MPAGIAAHLLCLLRGSMAVAPQPALAERDPAYAVRGPTGGEEEREIERERESEREPRKARNPPELRQQGRSRSPS